MKDLSSLKIGKRFSQLPSSFFTLVDPQPLENIRLVTWNSELGKHLGFPQLADGDTQVLPLLFGSQISQNFHPLAMKYAGHQFGVYNPELGDGRGLLLGELQDKQGQWHDLHLKGAGLTPYSRMGDGRAVLRSTIREYLCSEAMYGLGIPTTRALGMVTSETPVYRERVEQGAMLLRTATTHIRFGHFEHLFHTNQLEELKLLADKVIDWYWPECKEMPQPYAAMFDNVVQSTAKLVVKWQAVGFAHGVLNTDNMSIVGETFDYGPYAFLDDYQGNFICNHSDYQGRYAFNQQPRIGLWNLSALAHALSPLIATEVLEESLDAYQSILSREFSQQMRSKLGLYEQKQDDSSLFEKMFDVLEEGHLDYSYFMRILSEVDRKGPEFVRLELIALSKQQNIQDKIATWLNRYLERCEHEAKSTEERCTQMRLVNPKYILRNYLAQHAIEKAEKGDFGEVNNLAEVLKNPFSDQHQYDHYAQLPPAWGKKLEISCSS